MPLDPHKDGPELLRLREAGEGARRGPPQFSSHPSGGGVQPSPSKAEQAPGTRDAGAGEGVGQALVSMVLSITGSSPSKQETLCGISSQWCIEVLCCIFFQLQDYFNKATVLPSSYLHFPPAIALQGSAHTSPLDSNFPSARAF